MTKKTKRTDLPEQYERGFLAKMDGRTELARLLRDHYAAIADDLGGEAELSHVKAALVERFVFLEATLNKVEADMANDPEASPELMGRWIQGVNSLTGLAKVVGIERNQRTVDLKSYVQGNGSS